jgi:hypothetical protein
VPIYHARISRKTGNWFELENEKQKAKVRNSRCILMMRMVRRPEESWDSS